MILIPGVADKYLIFRAVLIRRSAEYADTVFEIYAQGVSTRLKAEFNYLQYTEYDPERTAHRTFKEVALNERYVWLGGVVPDSLSLVISE